jgi:hypothetical protein
VPISRRVHDDCAGIGRIRQTKKDNRGRSTCGGDRYRFSNGKLTLSNQRAGYRQSFLTASIHKPD